MDHKEKAISNIKTIEYSDSHQLNIESAFSTLGIFTYNQDRALSVINKLLNITYSYIQDNYKNYTIYKTIDIIQPPVLPTVIWHMITMGLKDKKKLNVLFDKLLQYQNWYIENRDPYNKGLISIFHPKESIRENSHDYDDALKNIKVNEMIDINEYSDTTPEINIVDDDLNRYIQIIYKYEELNWNSKKIYDEGLFNVCDPSVQFIFIKSCKDLYKIAGFLERKDAFNILEKWIDVYSFGSNYLWNIKCDAYTTLDLKTNTLYKNMSSGALLYAYADVGNKEQRDMMLMHIKRILYYSKYGFPSWDPNHIDFNTKKYWKGSKWCIINFMMSIGFRQSRQLPLSQKIQEYTLNRIEINDFFEYFNTSSGVGCGGINCPMTASIYLLFTI